MTDAKKIAIINEIKRLEREVAELRTRRHEILSGASSASLSSGGGSKSFTNWDPEKLDKAIADDLAQIYAYKCAIAGRSGLTIGHTMIRRA